VPAYIYLMTYGACYERHGYISHSANLGYSVYAAVSLPCQGQGGGRDAIAAASAGANDIQFSRARCWLCVH